MTTENSRRFWTRSPESSPNVDINTECLPEYPGISDTEKLALIKSNTKEDDFMSEDIKSTTLGVHYEISIISFDGSSEGCSITIANTLIEAIQLAKELYPNVTMEII